MFLLFIVLLGMVGLLLVIFGVVVTVVFDPLVNSFIFKVCIFLGSLNGIGFAFLL